MHGLNGGRWGQRAATSEIQRSTKMTTRRRATVSRRRNQSLNQRPTSPMRHSGRFEPSLDWGVEAGSVSFLRMEVDNTLVSISPRVVEIDL